MTRRLAPVAAVCGLLVPALAAHAATPGSIFTLAGSGPANTFTSNGNLAEFKGAFAGDIGIASQASLDAPLGIAVDAQGEIFVADSQNHRIRRVGPDLKISTIAGSGPTGTGAGSTTGDGGPATQATLNVPTSLAVDSQGDLYVSDNFDSRVRKIARDGTITTIAGTGAQGDTGDNGPAVGATLAGPIGLAVGSDGSVYVADSDNDRVRKIDPAGVITTVAGIGPVGVDANQQPVGGYSGDGGPANKAALNAPSALAVDAQGNLYIADTLRVRKVDTHGIITTVAGNGQEGFSGDGGAAVGAALDPTGLAVDAAGDLFLVDSFNQRIREVLSNGMIMTVAGDGTGGFAGDGGPAAAAEIFYPADVQIDGSGDLIFSDLGNNRVREVVGIAASGLVAGRPISGVTTTPLAGDVNGDGKVNIQDAVLALQIAVHLVAPTAAEAAAGDLNGDGKITVVDATLILRKAIGL